MRQTLQNGAKKVAEAASKTAKVCFRSPQNTICTVATAMLAISLINTIDDCATGNCNKTPEELNRLLHILNTTLTVGAKIVENILIRVIVPVAGGVVAGGAHVAIRSMFYKNAPVVTSTQNETRGLLQADNTGTERSEHDSAQP